MNGRALLFSRCFIGLLAYFLCGLAEAKFFSTTDGPTPIVSDPVGYTFSRLKANPTLSQNMTLFSNSCGTVAVGQSCYVTLSDPKVAMWSFSLKFYRLKDNPCESKKDLSAGEWKIRLLGVEQVGGVGAPTIINKDSFLSFKTGGFPSCDGSCSLVLDPTKPYPDLKDTYGELSNFNVYIFAPMKFTGEQCKSTEDDPAPKPKPEPPPKPIKDKKPESPIDCPPKTTFGKVNGVGMCVKNAPLPTDPNPPPKPGDKDACIGNCDKWDPDKDKKPTDPKPTDPKPIDPKPGPGGKTPPIRGPLSSDASKPASENASGPGDSSLSASCTDFKCKNKDPATCEIARLAWNNKCTEEQAVKDLVESDFYKNGNAAMSADGLEDMKKSLNFGENGTVDMEGVIKRDTFLNKGGLSDVSFTVMGKGFSLPFSNFNKYLSMMGKIAVAFSLLAAARILSSAV